MVGVIYSEEKANRGLIPVVPQFEVVDMMGPVPAKITKVPGINPMVLEAGKRKTRAIEESREEMRTYLGQFTGDLNLDQLNVWVSLATKKTELEKASESEFCPELAWKKDDDTYRRLKGIADRSGGVLQ